MRAYYLWGCVRVRKHVFWHLEYFLCRVWFYKYLNLRTQTVRPAKTTFSPNKYLFHAQTVTRSSQSFSRCANDIFHTFLFSYVILNPTITLESNFFKFWRYFTTKGTQRKVRPSLLNKLKLKLRTCQTLALREFRAFLKVSRTFNKSEIHVSHLMRKFWIFLLKTRLECKWRLFDKFSSSNSKFRKSVYRTYKSTCINACRFPMRVGKNHGRSSATMLTHCESL